MNALQERLSFLHGSIAYCDGSPADASKNAHWRAGWDHAAATIREALKPKPCKPRGGYTHGIRKLTANSGAA